MKRLKWFLIFVIVSGLCTLVYQMNRFNEKDAKRYGEDFMKVVTGQDIDTSRYWDIDSMEDLRKQMEESMEKGIDKSLEEESDIFFTEEEKDRVLKLLLKALSKGKYSVGDASRTEEGFEVPITIEPIIFYNGLFDGTSEATIEYIKEYGIDNIDFEKYDHDMLKRKFDNVDKNLDNPVYGEPVEKKLRLKKVEDYYTCLEEDAESIGEIMLSDKMDRGNVTPDSMKNRTEKILQSSKTGELDSSLEELDIIVAAKYYDSVQKSLDKETEDDSKVFSKYMSEEGWEKYRAFLSKIYELEKYEVADASETSDGYEVQVRKSLPNLDDLSENMDARLSDYVENMDYSGIQSEDDFYRAIFSEELNILLSEMEHVGHKEAKTYTLKYTKQGGMYNLDPKSLIDLMEAGDEEYDDIDL